MGRAKKRDTVRISRWLWVALGTLVFLIALTAGALGVAVHQFSQSDIIAPNVRIAGIAVGNLSGAQATALVNERYVSTLPPEIELKWPDGSLKVSRERLGVRLAVAEAVQQALRLGREGNVVARLITRVRLTRAGVDIPVRTIIDQPALAAALRALAGQIDRKPQNAQLKVTGSKVEVIPDKPGVVVDVDGSAAKLAAALADPALAEFDLVVKAQDARVRAKDLEGIDTVLGSYSTPYHAEQRDRTHNLKLALAKVSGAVLMPGEVLSLNQRIGPRQEEYGYRSAPIFVNGQVEPATGGGVCQVATTTYNAALLANLDVIERNHHSRPVTYVPSGLDATVYWGQSDLKIRNNLRHPVVFLTDMTDDEITVKVLGHKADKVEVVIERSGIATLSPPTQEISDPTLPIGQRKVEKPGVAGARATVTRIVKVGGKIVKQETLHTDTYLPQPRVVRVGTKPPAQELPGETVNALLGTAPQTPPNVKKGAGPPSVLPKAPSPNRQPTPTPKPPPKGAEDTVG
jgi:vancomycin resistance protein YoaR